MAGEEGSAEDPVGSLDVAPTGPREPSGRGVVRLPSSPKGPEAQRALLLPLSMGTLSVFWNSSQRMKSGLQMCFVWLTQCLTNLRASCQ